MTTPLWCLLFFVGWTLLLLLAGIAGYRVGSVLLGKARPNSFPADTPHGPDWYRRASRAHLNCVENLPIFASVVLVAHVAGVHAPLFDTLAEVYVVARVGQTVAHLSSRRALVVNIRFAFFATQLLCIGLMIATIVRAAA